MLITEELQNKLDKIKVFGEYQMAKNVCTSPSIGFEHEESGVTIINPFIDECGWEEVHPISYYGEDFLNSGFMKIELNNVDKYKNTDIIAIEKDCLKNTCLEYETDSYNFLYIYDFDVEIEKAVFNTIDNGYTQIQYDNKIIELYTLNEYHKINK